VAPPRQAGYAPRVPPSRWFVLLGAALCLAIALLECRHDTEPVPAVSFEMLSPEMQQKLRQRYPNVDQEWLEIVRRTCKVNAFANCVCCAPATSRACNPTNWQCCGSAVFSPADGSSCSIPDPCHCTPPPG
jgi:hypothetical protein